MTAEVAYRGDGRTTAFPVPFPLFDGNDVEVWIDGARLSAGYRATGGMGGGMAVLSVPPSPGSTVLVRRALAVAPTPTLPAGEAVSPQDLTMEFRRLGAAVERVADDVGRAVTRSPASTATADLTLPEPEPNRALTWNGDGTGLVNSRCDLDRAAAEAMRHAGDAATSAEAASRSSGAAQAAADAIINRAEVAAADATAEDLVYLAKATEAVGVNSAVGFINATSEMQAARVLASGDEQNARVISTGDAEVARVVQTMGNAVGVLSAKGDMLWHDGSGAARLPAGKPGQVLQVGADSTPQWGASKIVNTWHHFFADITRTTWGGKGNLLNGSAFTYTPVRAGSWFWVDHRVFLSTNQSYTATEIMLNVAGGGWQVTTSMPLKRGVDNWTSFGGSPYTTGSGNGYFYSDGNGAYKMVGSVLLAPAYALGQSIQFGLTAWSQGSNWFSVNEMYNQNNYVCRYGWSEVHVFELQPPA